MTDSSGRRSLSAESVELRPVPVQGATWSPHVGNETEALLDHLMLPDEGSRSRVRDEALGILRHCVAPVVPGGSQTGLVLGYVQSGKTMSFTTVAALARDNGYQLVIVIAGVSVPLFNQSATRLSNDLRLATRLDRKWKHLSNPAPDARQNIQSTLDEWSDSSIPEYDRQTILITVMKNHTHLRHLNELLSRLSLSGVPTLVVDDEADQAGLNSAVKRGEQSTTYRQLLALRGHLPHHTFLQYTATPQAPLLINLIDILSPRFVAILTPGNDYTGGRHYFIDSADLVVSIPQVEIPTKDNLLIDPPHSLLHAMRIFYLGVASAYSSGPAMGNRSMLVHPSQKTLPHATYFHWVSQTQSNWVGILKLGESDPDRQELIKEFREAYHDLVATVTNIPHFDELVKHLPRAINKTNVREMNAVRGRTPQVDWKGDYAHILVGGQAMDRGFTVEGLTVTYMPRDVGVGNADTVQQRARFFGYKAGYLQYCRVFLNPSAAAAYRAYVAHEEDIRARLQRHAQTGKPLSEWKRAFFLDGSLSPTRNSVLDLDYMKGRFSESWYAPRAPHDSEEAIVANREAVRRFLLSLSLSPDDGHQDRTEHQRHLVASSVSLAQVYECLLLQFRATRAIDSRNLIGAMLQVKRYLEDHPAEPCTVYQMSCGKERERSTGDNGDEIPNLFQGEHPKSTGHVYPGDRRIRASKGLTVQIHNLKVVTKNGAYNNVPAITIWVPSTMAGDWITQDQGIVV